MPIEVHRLDNEPIIIATLTGHVTVEEFIDMFKQSAAIAADIEGIVHRITDARQADTSFGELLSIVQEAGRDVPGSTVDPNMRPVLLGTSAMVRLAADLFQHKQSGGLQFPIFREFDDALTYIHNELTRAKDVEDETT